LPVIQYGVKGCYAGAIEHNIILGVSPNITNALARIKGIKFYLAAGVDDLQSILDQHLISSPHKSA
jgi:hypothetical protein